jgi:hypothetical protein
VPHLLCQRPCKSFINCSRDGVTAEVEASKYAIGGRTVGKVICCAVTSFVYKRPSRHAQYSAVGTAETLRSMHFTSAKSPLHRELLFGVLVAEEDALRTLVAAAAAAADSVTLWSHI